MAFAWQPALAGVSFTSSLAVTCCTGQNQGKHTVKEKCSRITHVYVQSLSTEVYQSVEKRLLAEVTGHHTVPQRPLEQNKIHLAIGNFLVH